MKKSVQVISRWCRGLVAVPFLLVAAWMAIYGMWASAAWTASFVASLRPWSGGVGRVSLVLFFLSPAFTWLVALPEYAAQTDRILCTVEYAMGDVPSFCDGVDYRRIEGGDTGPVLSTREHLGVSGFNVIMALGGYVAGFPEVADETLRLMWADPPVADITSRTIADRRRMCRPGAAEGGQVITSESDFFLDSTVFRTQIAAWTPLARTAEAGVLLGSFPVDVKMGGGSSTTAYFGAHDKPMTARTALALYVVGDVLSARSMGSGALEVTWEGGIFYPNLAGFTFPLHLPWGTRYVRLGEAAFCGLQMDGWFRPYVQRWVTSVQDDDPRLEPGERRRNDPGWFESIVGGVL